MKIDELTGRVMEKRILIRGYSLLFFWFYDNKNLRERERREKGESGSSKWWVEREKRQPFFYLICVFVFPTVGICSVHSGCFDWTAHFFLINFRGF